MVSKTLNISDKKQIELAAGRALEALHVSNELVLTRDQTMRLFFQAEDRESFVRMTDRYGAVGSQLGG